MNTTPTSIRVLGEAMHASPRRRTISDGSRVPLRIVIDPQQPAGETLQFELAGPRAKLFFDSASVCAGIVTCGGLCPGLNNVVRSLVRELWFGYGVRQILGFRDGYMGLDPARGRAPLELNPDAVDDIHKEGGTVLGTSRGPVDVHAVVSNLIQRGVNILFTIGGDGTQRGGNDLYNEAMARGHLLAVVGVPKTIDNDVAFVSRSFGYLTSVEESAKVLHCAHTEAKSVPNGIAIVKLMGRHAGFIAAGATIASQDVNFCLVPEVPFKLDGESGLLATLTKRMRERSHALVVVAEGAGQDLLAAEGNARDASGNIKLEDIGPFLRKKIEEHFKAAGIQVVIRYFDPSYMIRSVPADSEDSILCDLFARNAVHAAMAGKTGLVIGLIHDQFIHVPIALLTSQTKRMDVNGAAWQAVLATTRQPESF